MSVNAGPLTVDSVAAQLDQASRDVTVNYVLQSAYLVFFMHCGFAMLSIGCVRTRFAKHIAILILVDAAASAIGYYLFGYAFAFGDTQTTVDGSTVYSGNPFLGTNFFAMSGLPHDEWYLWVFQWSFAATACTIVSGAIAERARFEAYILYSLFMAAWVYPILTHSVWAPLGWCGMLRATSPRLLGVGAIDFAGSGAVHCVGGYAAAAGCAIIGPRIGRFLPDGTVVDMPGHNSSLFVLGVMILWFGWYGFNPGSQLALVGYSQAIANAAVTTTIAPASSALSALMVKALLGKIQLGRWTYDVMVMGNGALAGLVAITAGCSVIYPWGAILVGGFAGVLYNIASIVSLKLHWDDPLDAIAVHAWNGSWGVIATGLLAGQGLVLQSYGSNPEYTGDFALLGDQSNLYAAPNDYFRQWGCFLGGNGLLLGCQIIYLMWLCGWVLGMMIPFWFILKLLGILRVPAEEETLGLDESYHGGHAYPGHDVGGYDDNSMSGRDKGGGDGDMKMGNGSPRGAITKKGGQGNPEYARLESQIQELRATMKEMISQRVDDRDKHHK